MCGIVGFYGKSEEVVEILINGLKKLEYRGYDSAGIALIVGGETGKNKLFVEKATGKVIELEKKLAQTLASATLADFGNIGIAHTRWATHGEPSEANAHPHFSFDGKVAVVHNGIIENYKELKSKLEAEGVVFLSKTDTEVVAHLVAKNYKGDIKQAALDTFKMLRGAFAFGIIHTDEPGRLIGAKKGSPLLLGIGTDELILASDVSAVISKTQDVIYLDDGEMVDINAGEFNITNFETDLFVKHDIQKVEWTEEEATKLGYEHFMIKEIMEQPCSIVDSIRGRLDYDTGNVRFGGLLDIKDRLSEIDRVILLGIGTSYYACKLGEMYFEELTGLPTKAEMSPEFRFKGGVVDERTWVIVLSQSGETFDTIAAIKECQQKGALVTGIVNVVGSTISRMTDAGVYNHIGPEMSVASTKAFTSQVLLLLMHAIYLGRAKNITVTQGQKLIQRINALPEMIKKVLEQNDKIITLAQKYHTAKDFLYLGSKLNYPIALEGALKIKEISHSIHAEGLSCGELKHGFIALVDENRPSFVLATKDTVFDKTCNSIEQVKARKGPVIAIISDEDPGVIAMVDDYILVPACGEKTQPIVNNVVFQLFAYHCSRLNGLDVDKPRNLAKSVTVE
jgi:glutamine---fructose-6-phosphate transaminase (isomerizing)